MSGRKLSLLLFIMLLAGCQSMSQSIRTENNVDINRFMGDWYVIANIPTFIEKGAHNAVESYELNEDGTIATTFTFNKDSFNGELKQYHPKGFIVDKKTNAVWGMQFIWPIKADYRIVYLNDDYTQTIIGREKRDYVWIMARTPHIPERDYLQMLKLLAEQDYDISQIKKVPQQ